MSGRIQDSIYRHFRELSSLSIEKTGLLLTAKKLELTNCTSDILTISTKDESHSFCNEHGLLPPRQLHYSEDEFILEFKSGMASSDYGFDVSWKCDKTEQISAPVTLERNLNFSNSLKTVVLSSFDEIIENNSIENEKRLLAIRSSFARMSSDIERTSSRKERSRKCVVKGRSILQDTLSAIPSTSTIDGLQDFLEKIRLYESYRFP